jgi:predicted deacylase
MSIKQTKEQIAAYPTYDGWASLHSGDDSSPTVMPISHLIALANSHTALLEAAKGFIAAFYATENLEGDVGALQAAVQQAEQAEGEGGSLTLEQMREHVARQNPNYRDRQEGEG